LGWRGTSVRYRTPTRGEEQYTVLLTAYQENSPFDPPEEAHDGYVSLHSVLAHYLQRPQRQTPHMKDMDFAFPSFKARGRALARTRLENGLRI
jgi:hypothetical protein